MPLQNLKPYRDEFRFRPDRKGTATRITVSYGLGGQNYFSGGLNPRGVSVHVTETTVEGDHESQLLYNVANPGFSILAKALPRRSAKAVLAVAERIDRGAPAIAAMFSAKQRDDAAKLIRYLLAGGIAPGAPEPVPEPAAPVTVAVNTEPDQGRPIESNDFA